MHRRAAIRIRKNANARGTNAHNVRDRYALSGGDPRGGIETGVKGNRVGTRAWHRAPEPST